MEIQLCDLEYNEKLIILSFLLKVERRAEINLNRFTKTKESCYINKLNICKVGCTKPSSKQKLNEK